MSDEKRPERRTIHPAIQKVWQPVVDAATKVCGGYSPDFAMFDPDDQITDGIESKIDDLFREFEKGVE